VNKLLAALATPFFVWFAAWTVAVAMQNKADRAPWPEHLCALVDTPRHFPDVVQSASATELTTMTAPLGVSITPRNVNPHISPEPFDAIKQSLRAYVDDPGMVMPAGLSAYLAAHAEQLDRIRDHLLSAGPIRWPVRFRLGEDAPVPNLLGHMSLTRLFIARAVSRSSWDELHAAWLLDRPLWDRPELISAAIGIATTRMINKAAAKLPPPAPAWFGELRSLDYQHRLAGSYQAEAWTHERVIDHLMKEHRIVRAIITPWLDMCAADSVERMRVRTTELVSGTNPALAHEPVVVARWNTIGRASVSGIFFVWERLQLLLGELKNDVK